MILVERLHESRSTLSPRFCSGLAAARLANPTSAESRVKARQLFDSKEGGLKSRHYICSVPPHGEASGQVQFQFVQQESLRWSRGSHAAQTQFTALSGW